jgi:hypothetical protein
VEGNEHYQNAIQAAEKDMQGWIRLRNAADLKIGQLRSAIKILTGLLEEPPKAAPQEAAAEEIGDMGITEAIRAVLRGGTCVTPANAKEDLAGMGFDLSKYANPSAVIHNTLKRLEAQGEIVAVDTPSGTAYALRPSSFEKELAESRFWETAATGVIRTHDQVARKAADLMKPSDAAPRAAEAMLSPGARTTETVIVRPRPPKPPGVK